MDRGEPSLKPEWLVRGVATPTVAATGFRPGTSPRADDQDRGASSRNRSSVRDRERSSQQSASRRGSGPSVSRRHDRDGTVKSRGYASFGRSNRDRGCDKDSDFRDWESRLGLAGDPLRDGSGPFNSCRPESDRLNRIRPKLDTLNRSSGASLDNGNLSRKDAGGMSFEREFPHLSSEDNNGKHDVVRVPSPGIGSPIQSIPLVTAPDGWNSVLAEVPGLSEPSNTQTSSASSRAGSSQQLVVPNCGTALSMAETVMQTPLKISTTPPLSIDAQKIEERTMRQCILRPLTPSSNKNSVSTLSDRLKTKGARAGDSNSSIKTAPQLSSAQSSNNSVRTPVKSEVAKPSQPGSFQVLTREQNGAANTSKDSTSNSLSPILGRSSSVEPLKKPLVNQKLKGVINGLPLHLQQGPSGERKSIAKDKHKFFELLRSKSLNGSSTGIESSSSLIDEQKNPCLDLSLFNAGIKCIETGSSSCEDANSCDVSQRHFSGTEETKASLEPHDVFYREFHGVAALKDTNSLSDHADFENGSMSPQADKAEATLAIMAADINDGSAKADSSYGDAGLLFAPIVAGEEESYPTEDEPSPEEMAFLKSLGWKEDEVVPPLKQEEIADCLRHNVRLQQKLEECRG